MKGSAIRNAFSGSAHSDSDFFLLAKEDFICAAVFCFQCHEAVICTAQAVEDNMSFFFLC